MSDFPHLSEHKQHIEIFWLISEHQEEFFHFPFKANAFHNHILFIQHAGDSLQGTQIKQINKQKPTL